MRKEILDNIERIIEAGAPDPRMDHIASHILVLNDYQVANLKAFIQSTGYASVYKSPLSVANNGDWLGELYWMLSKIETGPPNATAEELAKRANEFKQQ